MKHFIIFITIICNLILSQEQIGPLINGTIIDADTREPIANANIFIANSSIGCASDKNGYFELRNLPYGRYEIIASVIGYEMIKAQIGVYNNRRQTIRFEMYKQPIQFPEVIVSAKEAKKRNRQLQKFRTSLLGASQNSKKTYIKNEDVIRFNNDEYGMLIAYADEPLEIINNSLGYRIHYVLEDFELTEDYVKYTGYPHFVEQTATTYHDFVDWPENRERTYTGSLRHFLTTICENYEITQGDTTERAYLFNMADVIKHGVKITYGDTTHIEEQGFYVVQTSDKSGARLVNINRFLSETDNPNEMYLQFGGYLRIHYDNELFPFEKRFGSKEKTSWIKITCDSTVLDKQGRYFDIYAIKTSGLWSKERVADMLPFDYTIGED